MSSANVWPVVCLDEICLKITDGAHQSPSSVEHGLPMASVKDMTRFGLNLATARKISYEDFAKLVRQGCRPEKNDILIAKDGATALDTVCFVSVQEDVVLLSSVAIIRPDPSKIFPNFLRYYLDCSSTKSYMKTAFTTGAAIPRVVLKDFKKVEVKIPPLNVQKCISVLVGQYDNLIENNTRRIAVLEEMARRIYEEWFVHFRYPGHEQDQKVETELGLVPEGWEIKPMSECIELAYGKALKAENRIPGPFPVYGSSGIVGSHESALVAAPGIVVGRKGNVGSVFWAHEPFYPIDTAYYIKTKLPLLYVFHNLQKQNFINNDAAVPGLSRNQAYLLPVINPAQAVLDLFLATCQPIHDLQITLGKKNANLRQTRDLLLPRLISGELDVSTLVLPDAA